ncbi:MAG: DUF4347 domain-containing protein [Magnetococcales bacterium]|nr:DUF4347 domain-containing protein [Magnetococcales bacterium]MBF0149988.1 DUF4347 domain-containing protein [Magnetococcales bacterium]
MMFGNLLEYLRNLRLPSFRTIHRETSRNQSDPRFIPLEPRLMFDASAFLFPLEGINVHGAALDDPPPQTEAAPWAPAITSHQEVAPEKVADEVANEIVFVDASVPIPSTWLEKEHTTIVTLSPQGDGLDEITRFLADKNNIKAIHILSHGDTASLWLGTSHLTREALEGHSQAFRSWQETLTPDGDILLYGCNVARGDPGMSFISRLADLTGADVAASTNLTGSASRGGNWELEARSGSIETALILDPEHREYFDGTLATITVTSNLDTGDFDGTVGGVTQVTLREALSHANNDNNTADSAGTAGSGTDIITFDPSLSGTTITLNGSALTISSSLTIDADLNDDGTPDITIDGNNNSRIFSVNSGTTVTLTGLVLTQGDSGGNDGGAIRNSGNLTFADGTITQNTGDKGAGIYNASTGTLTVNNSTISLNTGTNDGAGIYNNAGSLTITNSTITQNSLGNDQGGGVYSKDGTLTISGSTFSDNTSTSNGGGLYIDNSTTTITATTFTGNQATDGAGIYNNNNNPVDLVNVTLSSNIASSQGGGIYNAGTALSLTGSTVTGNTAPSGAGIYNFTGSQLQATTSTVDVVAGSGTYSGSWVPNLDLDASNTADNHFSATFTEGGSALNITDTDVSITDPDSATIASVTLILTNRPDGTAETLSVNGALPGGITVTDTYDNADGQMILSGVTTLANYQTALTQIQYNNTSQNPDTTNRVITLSVNDGTNSSSTAQSTLTLVRTNDAPTFTGLNATPTFTEGGSAVVLDADVTVSDPELDSGTFSGATLQLVRSGGANGEDVFGTNGNLAFSGTNLNWNGTTVGAITTNSGGTLLLQFNANATTAIVNSVLQNITYTNSSEVPGGSVQIGWTLNDGNSGTQGSGGSASATGSITVTLAGVNDAPTFARLDATPTFTEGGDAIVLDADVTVTDLELDAATYHGATLTLARSTGANSDDLFGNSGALGALTEGTALVYNNVPFGWVTTHANGTLILTFNDSATPTLVDSVLQAITYRNTSATPETAVGMTWTFSDGNTMAQGTGGSHIIQQTQNISLVAIDAPVITPPEPVANVDPVIVAEPVVAEPVTPVSSPPVATSPQPIPPVVVTPTPVVVSTPVATTTPVSVVSTPAVSTPVTTTVSAPVSAPATPATPATSGTAATSAPSAPAVEAAASAPQADAAPAAEAAAAEAAAAESGGTEAAAGDSAGNAGGAEGQAQAQGGSNATSGNAKNTSGANSGSNNTSGTGMNANNSQGDSDTMFISANETEEKSRVVEGFGGSGLGRTEVDGFGSSAAEAKPTEGFGSSEATKPVEGFSAASDAEKQPRPEGFSDSSDAMATQDDVGYLDEEEDKEHEVLPIDVTEIDPYSNETESTTTDANVIDRLEVTPYGDEETASTEPEATNPDDAQDQEGEELTKEPVWYGKKEFTIQLRAAAFGNTHLERMMILKKMIESGQKST